MNTQELTTEIGKQFAEEIKLLAVELHGEVLLIREREHTEFVSGFRRSYRGNLWREWRGANITVFSQKETGYAWSICTGKGQIRYSPRRYKLESEALNSLAQELGVGL